MEPILEQDLNGGRQRVYRFDNGYGASVVRHRYSYGCEQGLWELAVLRFYGPGPDEFDLTYATPITSDVVGRLTETAVQSLLEQIKDLPADDVTEDAVRDLLQQIKDLPEAK